jgi:hypothetical protein
LLQVGDPTLSITGFTFDANLRDTGSEPFMEIVGGGMNAFRLHYFEMINLIERGISIDLDGNEGSGLIDHCTFGMPVKSGGSKALSLLRAAPGEHQPFSRPLELGSAKFFFIEDCTFNYGGQNDGALDAYSGARYVFRHNIVNNTHVEHHGADSGFIRGIHSFEIYENKFTCTRDCENQRKFYFRSGTGVVFNNTFTGNYSEAGLTNYRSDESFPPWGICNGSSPWDENRPGQNGYTCLDQIRHVFGPMSGGANRLEPLYERGNTQNGGLMWISSSRQAMPTSTNISSKVAISTTTCKGQAISPTHIPIRLPELTRSLRLCLRGTCGSFRKETPFLAALMLG